MSQATVHCPRYAVTKDGIHNYMAKACYHGHHAYCTDSASASGAPEPKRCEHCSASCICQCHKPEGAQR